MTKDGQNTDGGRQKQETHLSADQIGKKRVVRPWDDFSDPRTPDGLQRAESEYNRLKLQNLKQK